MSRKPGALEPGTVVEPEAEAQTYACACCGVETTMVIGYIYEEAATIVYKATFVRDASPDRAEPTRVAEGGPRRHSEARNGRRTMS